ncbi:MAG: energy-coupling factor ABC transporter ATP-binding protein [Geminocystis sp.]|nr:energy-coupling factor ABC transporter ATP-binding protein [Geminocystis sp.]HIK38226.1 ABC transporter ATP-binding protein [Geminocystis sp. M7585_C2015_104]MCS7148636.1 energy-coupling factor ABC transporter ATP-binding protein [Geminocystis sp.]MCX8079566.1 energy-coupling factor ABC transporter ATP-binding protein [Geminocystis sp.]MDW8115050.1 ABC transporter ATP-binding protein [Geminocystis sp.]
MRGEGGDNSSGGNGQDWAILVENLSFSWDGKTRVLDSCTLAVPRGELWMLLGSNGCGKSTLLRILANLLMPDSGDIYIESPMGFVFQNPDHQLVMPTVGADIAFGLVAEKLTLPQIRERVKEALAAVNLPDFQMRPIHTLSGGQKQRVAIAGALARHCRVLLLDEPTALLDSDTQMELVSLVRTIVKEKHITALWVTHRLEELKYADGYFLLKGGRVVQQGHPRELGIITS